MFYICSFTSLLFLCALAPLTESWWGLFECEPDEEGGGCSAFCPCEQGMTCEAGVHRCHSPGGVGKSCHLTKPCRKGLLCEAGSQVCRAPGKTGDPCHVTRPCAPGYFCKSLVHKCERFARPKQSCYPQSLEHLGRRCNDVKRHWCDPVTRTCVTPSRKGGPCGYMGGREDDGLCVTGLTCECKTSCDIQQTLQGIHGNGKLTLKDWVKKGNTFCCQCLK